MTTPSGVASIRGGSGLGDALYVQAVARYLVARGRRLEVCTAWPDVFRPLRASVEFAPFRRKAIDILAHYSARKSSPHTQFDDVCAAAGLPETAELRLDWTPVGELGARLERERRSVVLVQLPREPMARTDGFGAELLPRLGAIQTAIDALRERGALIVQIGAGRALHEFRGIDIDLANKTTVTDLLDVAMVARAFLGYVSYFVPLAESFDRRALLVWSARGLASGTVYVRQITPKKILFKPTSSWVLDTDDDEKIRTAARSLLY